jgi:general secretion pathway protein A
LLAGGIGAISTYATCFVLVCLAVGLYRVFANRTERVGSVSRETLGVGIGLAARPVRVSESIDAVTSPATPRPPFQAVAAGVYRDVGSVHVRSGVRAPAKSYYASSEGQVQLDMLPPLGIPSETQDLSTAVPAAEWDSTNLGWNNLRLLLPERAEGIGRVDGYVDADADAQPRQEATDVTRAEIESIAGGVLVDADVSLSEDRAQVVEIAPALVAEGNGNCSDGFCGEETIEILEIAPAAIDGGAADFRAETDHAEFAEIEAAPVAVETDAALSFGAAPVHEAIENVDAALVPVMADDALEISVAADQDSIPCADIAAAPIADENGEELGSIELAEVQEAGDRLAPPTIAAASEPLAAAFGFLSFYGLSEQPFDVTPDPAYLYFSPMHREALDSLSKGVENLRGFMALVAEPGMGKTTLLNRLMEELHDTARTVLLFQTQCNSRELLRYLLSELGIESASMDVVSMHRALNEVLFQEMLNGRRFVLIIDEAQNLDATTLETIRLLSDFETSHAKLIQIVLAGQPQLIETLLRPELSQLRQRIAILTNLEPLCASETAQYIEHRLRAAGSSDRAIFTPEALALIAERSHGIPRSINNLCFNALQIGYSKECGTIDAEIVWSVADKLDLEALLPRRAQEPVSAPEAIPAAASPSSELARLLLDALTGAQQAAQQLSNAPPAKTAVELTGKLSEKLKTRSWGKECEYRIQVSLEREASPEIPVADRYYCCSIYVGEEQAKLLQAGRPVRIRIEQD